MKRAGSASSLAHLRDVCGKARACGAHKDRIHAGRMDRDCEATKGF